VSNGKIVRQTHDDAGKLIFAIANNAIAMRVVVERRVTQISQR
jgi:hypothetical protein